MFAYISFALSWFVFPEKDWVPQDTDLCITLFQFIQNSKKEHRFYYWIKIDVPAFEILPVLVNLIRATEVQDQSFQLRYILSMTLSSFLWTPESLDHSFLIKSDFQRNTVFIIFYYISNFKILVTIKVSFCNVSQPKRLLDLTWRQIQWFNRNEHESLSDIQSL